MLPRITGTSFCWFQVSITVCIPYAHNPTYYSALYYPKSLITAKSIVIMVHFIYFVFTLFSVERGKKSIIYSQWQIKKYIMSMWDVDDVSSFLSQAVSRFKLMSPHNCVALYELGEGKEKKYKKAKMPWIINQRDYYNVNTDRALT